MLNKWILPRRPRLAHARQSEPLGIRYVDWLSHTLTSWAFTGLVATTLREGAEEWNARPLTKVLESVFLNI
jgi:hypothetical protein